MGAGLQKAAAAAKATQIKPEVAAEMRRFFQAISDYSGAATPQECPLSSRAQDRARQQAKRLGWVTFEGGYWRLTDAGKAAFRNI